jgi:hypothetical protein
MWTILAKILPWRVLTRLDKYRKQRLLRSYNSYQLPVIALDTLVSDVGRLKPEYTDDICLPPHHQGTSKHDDFTPLIRIAQGLSPHTVVELGTAYGNTVANICKSCPTAHVYTVNAPAADQSGNIVTFSLTREEIGRSYRRHGYQDRVTQIFENTLDLDLSQHLSGAQVDLAIIDACHDTTYVLNDFHKVRPFMRPGGIVLFHDTHPSMEDHLEGSYVACMLLRKAGFEIRQIEGCWWGIWINGGSPLPINASGR